MNFLTCANAFLHGLHVLTKSPSFDSHTTFKNPTTSSLINTTLIDHHIRNVHSQNTKAKDIASSFLIHEIDTLYPSISMMA